MKHRDDLEEAIKDSDHFFILATESFFLSAMTYVQVEIAKIHKKPFRIALRKGVEIPEGFLDDVEDYEIVTWETADELKSAFIELIGEDQDAFDFVNPYVKN